MKSTALSFLAAATLAGSALAQDKPVNAGPYVPSPQSVVTDMLKLAGVSDKDFVIDLGSGDGRIVLTAAKGFGARGFGVEIQDKLVKLSNEAAQKEGIADRVKFITQDSVQDRHLAGHRADDVPAAEHGEHAEGQAPCRAAARTADHLARLSSRRLDPGAVRADGPGGQGRDQRRDDDVDLPVRRAGESGRQLEREAPANGGKAAVTRLDLKQQVTRFSGSALVDGKSVPLEDAKLKGDQISFKVAGRNGTYSGTVKDGAISGTFAAGSTRKRAGRRRSEQAARSRRRDDTRDRSRRHADRGRAC
jgi:hypothetical protein